jgi:hypothetical protein
MRKGLTVTLMATLVAMLAVNAMAEAPTIGGIPDVVVGGDAGATPPLEFVFPDALALDGYVNDDTSPSEEILWSYTTADPGNARYAFNGVDAVDLGSDNPNAPGAKQIDTNDNDPSQLDNDPRTATVRDAVLSPIGGDTTDPGATGIVASEVVTLIASDGSTYTMKEIIVYTDNGGEDRLSPQAEIVLPKIDLTQTPAGDAGFDQTTPIGAVTYSTANGACITVPATGANLGSFLTDPNFIDLTARSVYQIRCEVATDQSGDGQVPFWDVVIANLYQNHPVTGAPLNGPNSYGGDYLFLDADGGANAAEDSVGKTATRGRRVFEIWYAPPQVDVASWNDTSTGAFSATNNPIVDFSIEFRVLDVDGGHQPATNPDLGTVCLQSIEVFKHDFDQLMANVTGTVYDVSNITASTHNVNFLITGSTTVSFSGGNVTVSPTASPGWEVEVVSVNPGDGVADPVTGTGVPDDYPIDWVDDTLFAVQVTASAPNALGESDPPDALRLGIDTITNELFGLGYVTPTLDQIGSIKNGQQNTFYTFAYGHSRSLSPVAADVSLRPRIDLLNAPTFKAYAEAENRGGITFHAVKVDTVDKPN